MAGQQTPKLWEYNYSGEPYYDPMPFILANGSALVNIAQSMTKYSVSHREVYVGATAAVNNPQLQQVRFTAGFNYSPYKGIDKFCAEMRSIGPQQPQGFVDTEACFTSFDPVDGQKREEVVESILGAPYRLLLPCKPCTRFMGQSTLVLTCGLEDDIFGVTTGRSLKQVHPGLNPPTKKQRPQDHRVMSEPVFKYSSLDWVEALGNYFELTAGLDPSKIDGSDALRSVQSNAAVLAIMSCAELA